MYSVKKMINYLVCVTLTTFTGSLVHAEEGVWRDSVTGLSWMRCSIGQKWTGKTCTGEPLRFTWQDSLDFVTSLNRDGGFASRTDWRVPTIEELSTIRKCSNGWELKTTGYKYKATAEGKVEIKGNIRTTTLPNGQSVPYSCADGSSRPTLNTSIFPNTKDSTYWSSSPYASHGSNAWVVDFYFGFGSYDVKNYGYYVRLVRSSQ